MIARPWSKLRTDEGHLGGYRVDGPAKGTWCPAIWRKLIMEIAPANMLDVGCGMGWVMHFFKMHGVATTGVDGSPSATRHNPEVVEWDYTKGRSPVEGVFDLVWSSEFAEHVDEQHADNFLNDFAKAKKMLMVTAAKPEQEGHNHVNCQPPSYWIDKITKLGFTHNWNTTHRWRKMLSPPTIHGLGQPEGVHFRRNGLVFLRR